MLGTEVETSLWGHRALFGAVWPAHPITPMGSKGLKQIDRGTWQGICSQPGSTDTLPLPHPGQFATVCPKAKVHLSPCPRSLGLKMDSQDHTSSSRSSLSAFLSRPSRDRNRAFQHKKHLMTPQQGQSCVLASQCSLLFGKGLLNQQRACEQGGRGSDLCVIRPALVCLGDTLTLWGPSQP